MGMTKAELEHKGGFARTCTCKLGLRRMLAATPASDSCHFSERMKHRERTTLL